MTLGTTHRWLARGIGLVLAGGLSLAAMTAWRMPEGRGVLGADVLFASGPTGELAVEPAGPFLTASGLGPGDAPREGAIAVRNQTGVTLAVSLRTSATTSELADLLWVQVRAEGDRLFRGPLGDLTEDGTAPFDLASGQERIVEVRSWLPPGTEGHEGLLAEVVLDPVGVRAGG